MVRYGKRKCVTGRCDPDLQRELLAHELAHWATRVKHCGEERVKARAQVKGKASSRSSKTRKRARTCPAYRGEHNPRFYQVLDWIQKKLGNSPERARILEKRAGYKPPSHYMR